MIKRLYGVTSYVDPDQGPEPSISVYEIYIDKSEGLVVRNIATKGPPDVPLGARLRNGEQLGISSHWGLQLYSPSRSNLQRIDEVNSKVFGGGNSGLVALFSHRDAAMNCFETPDLKHWDQRFHDPTINTLQTIELAGDYRVQLSGEIHRAVQENRIKQYLVDHERSPAWKLEEMTA